MEHLELWVGRGLGEQKGKGWPCPRGRLRQVSGPVLFIFLFLLPLPVLGLIQIFQSSWRILADVCANF